MAKKNAALITGAAKRIGYEMALHLASQGFDIAINYNNSKAEAQNLAKKIKSNFAVDCEIFQADLSSKEEAQDLINLVLKKFPHLNLLVNNASIFSKSKFLTAKIDEFFNNLNIHLVSPMVLSKEFAAYVVKNNIEEASIINMVDKNIIRFDTSYFHYLLSKKFLAELTKMLATELAPVVRVNAIAPGFILNSIDEKNPENETQNLLKKIPLKQQGDVKNILQALDFFLQNKYVTGEIIFVDGGASLVS